MKKFILLIISLLLICIHSQAQPQKFDKSSIQINEEKILSNAPALNPKALRYAVKGYQWAVKHHTIKKPILTLVDFNLPSYKKRMWVINLKTSKTLMKLYTTQGKGSGLVYARHFSNHSGTTATSLGVYLIDSPYYGKHGLSARLKGLERGVNNNAFKRSIVIHPAWYATPDFVKRNHRTGRSYGCFAINPAVSKKFIDLTKNGSILFAYATPEENDPYIT